MIIKIKKKKVLTRQAKWALKQKKAGKCRVCPKDAVDATHCEEHRDKNAAYRRDSYAKSKAKTN